MRVQKNNGSRMFLTELLFSILFFIIVVAVCVELFARAHATSVKAQELTKAVNAASNCAEYFLTWDGESESWRRMFVNSNVTEEGFVNYLDKKFMACEPEDAIYAVAGTFEYEGNLVKAEISVKDVNDEREIYTLQVDRAIFLED